MYSCSEPQVRPLLCSKPQIDLLAHFLSRHPFELPGTQLPGELLLKGEGTPRTAGFDLLGPQAQQQQIRHEGGPHRSLNSGRVLGHLRLAQAPHVLQLFTTEFHGPSSEVACHRRVNCGICKV